MASTIPIKETIVGFTSEWKKSAEILKTMGWPLKVQTSAQLSKFGVSLKIIQTIVHLKESLWLELQKAWDDINFEVFRKYIDTMSERCVKRES